MLFNGKKSVKIKDDIQVNSGNAFLAISLMEVQSPM